MEWKTVVIFDSDEDRRNAIYRALAPSAPVIPVSRVADLGSSWPESAWFFVHDDPQLLAELHREFARQRVFLPIVVYSETLAPECVVKAIYGGAVNYVQWPSDAATVLNSVGSVAALARRRCEEAAARLIAQDRLASLSPRELEVARCVGEGMTSKEIGRSLGISHRTVEIHRSNALSKLGARNTADAARILADADDARANTLEAA